MHISDIDEIEITAPEDKRDDDVNRSLPDAANINTRFAVTAIVPQGLNLLEMLAILFERRTIILRSTFAAAVLASLIVLILPNRYTATTNILPPQQSPSLAASMIGQLGAMGPMAALAQKDLGLKNPNDLYVGMLRSRTMEDEQIGRAHV